MSIADEREKRTKLEAYLDRDVRECHLRDKRVAAVVEGSLLHEHDQQYELQAWCMMPNHVHVLAHVWQKPLRDEEQEPKAIRYIECNSVKSKLCRAAEEWPFSSVRFRDEYSRLRLPERAGAPAFISCCQEWPSPWAGPSRNKRSC